MEILGKSVGGGLALQGLSGSAIGTGILFGSLIYSVSRNPAYYDKLFTLSIISFALIESFALFSLLIAFLLMFS